MAAKATADRPSPADPPRHTACAGLLQPAAQRAWNRGSWSGPAWCTPPSIITRFVLPPPPQAEDAASGLPGAATNLQRPPYGARHMERSERCQEHRRLGEPGLGGCAGPSRLPSFLLSPGVLPGSLRPTDSCSFLRTLKGRARGVTPISGPLRCLSHQPSVLS